MTRRTWWLASAIALAAAWPGCEGGGANPEQVCEPGTEVFCRPCEGNPDEPGTKTCNADGSGFDACVPRSGECAVVGCTPGESLFCTCDGGAQGEKLCNADGTGYAPCECGAGGSAGAGGSGGSVGTGGSGGASGDKTLFAPCFEDSECQSGSCPMGYCTKTCTKISDCPFGESECVPKGASAICMPTCKEQLDCDVYGSPSECGYAHAIDDFPVTTCADWLSALELPPDGSDCADDLDCNLGHEGQERVCAFDACTEGCYEAKDCPASQECSGNGNLGSCQ